MRAETIRAQAGAVTRALAERGLPVCWCMPDRAAGQVVFLYTIITLPPYGGEGREYEVSRDRLRFVDAEDIADEIMQAARDELLEHQLGTIAGLN